MQVLSRGFLLYATGFFSFLKAVFSTASDKGKIFINLLAKTTCILYQFYHAYHKVNVYFRIFVW